MDQQTPHFRQLACSWLVSVSVEFSDVGVVENLQAPFDYIQSPGKLLVVSLDLTDDGNHRVQLLDYDTTGEHGAN